MTRGATSDTLTTAEWKLVREVNEQTAWVIAGSHGRPPSQRLCTRCGFRPRALTLGGEIANNSICNECGPSYFAEMRRTRLERTSV